MNCPVCERHPELGEPSRARWVGPDGKEYCSLHFIQKFGHGERLVKIGNYRSPRRVKAPATKGA